MIIEVLGVLIILGFLAGSYFIARKEGKIEIAVCAVFGLLFGFVVALLVSTIGSMMLGYIFGYTWKTEQYKLANIEDGNSLSGKFFLGSGTIDERPVFTYYAIVDGAAGLHQIDAKGVKVYQDTNEPYVVQQIECVSNHKWLYPCVESGKIESIHIPQGSIKSNFNLDARLENDNNRITN